MLVKHIYTGKIVKCIKYTDKKAEDIKAEGLYACPICSIMIRGPIGLKSELKEGEIPEVVAHEECIDRLQAIID